MERLNKRANGKEGEEMAVGYLIIKGYSILERNYRNPFGEIDLIAKDGKTVVFIEVKRRNTDSYGLPVESVDIKKQKRLSKAATAYITEKRITNLPCRFDVVSIYNDRIELFKDAFDLPEGFLW